MSRGGFTFDRDGRPLRGLYRDRENGWIFGVCAGLAEYWNVNTGLVRVVAVVCLFVEFWAAAVVYLVATLLFKTKPLTWSGRCHESEFWRRHGGSGEWRHS